MTVYFIAAEGLDRVKIGTTNNVERRFAHLKTGVPFAIVLLATEPGGADRERELHELFAPYRIMGEWFSFAPAIQAHVATLPPAVAKEKAFGPTAMAAATGWAVSYCSEMLTGNRAISLTRAVAIHAFTGRKMGPIADATDGEIEILAKFMPPHRADLTPAKAIRLKATL